MARVLVIEDEPQMRDLVRDCLAAQGYEVRSCGDGLEALELEASWKPDILVLDILLPGLDGIEVAKRVRDRSSVPIIMVTARDAEADRLLGLEVGADDYLTKPYSLRELVARIRAILRRTQGPVQDRPQIRLGQFDMDLHRRILLKEGRPIALTSTQFDLLRVLMAEPARVFTRKELVEATNGAAYEGYERTIDVQVRHLRKAIEADPSQPRHLVTVWGVGYKFEP